MYGMSPTPTMGGLTNIRQADNLNAQIAKNVNSLYGGSSDIEDWYQVNENIRTKNNVWSSISLKVVMANHTA
jgi:hypothetical protein